MRDSASGLENRARPQEFADFKIFKADARQRNEVLMLEPVVQLYNCSKSTTALLSRILLPGEEVRAERSNWVSDISTAIRLVTQSLFPPFRIASWP
ncbi:unnamed protein product [Symbiodinium sp. CCMP2592]|nr:unnamed protein product [Symbiodinium sp. CCMP2592]